MSTSNSWLRIYFTLRADAMHSRGSVELRLGPHDVTRFPRTTGVDVIAIAAVVDPYIRGLSYGFGAHGLALKWAVVAEELARLAFANPRNEYPDNERFWRILASICVYLHAEETPLPPAEIVDAIRAQLGEPRAHAAGPQRDAPFMHGDPKTFDELFLAQLDHLRLVRGADEVDVGMTIGDRRVPRTHNGDVVQLADYWSRQLDHVKRISGHDGIAAFWQKAVADVERLARNADPYSVYAENPAFWRALSKTAVHVAAADESPSASELMIASLERGLTSTNLGTPLLVGAGLVGLFLLARGGTAQA